MARLFTLDTLAAAQDRIRRAKAIDKAQRVVYGVPEESNMEFVDIGTGTMRIDQRAKADAAPLRHAGGASSPPLFVLVSLCRQHGLPEPIPEYRFHATRRWRFDYAWPIRCLAVEIEGGVWTQGRHTRGSGFVEDMKKYNAAAMLGWRILRYQPNDLATAIADLRIEFAKGAA